MCFRPDCRSARSRRRRFSERNRAPDEGDGTAGVGANPGVATAATGHVEVVPWYIWLPAPVAQMSGISAPAGGKLILVPLFKLMMPPPVALPPILPPRHPYSPQTGRDDLAWLSARADAVGEQCGDAAAKRRQLITDPLWKMIWPPVCAESGGRPVALVPGRPGAENDGAVGLGQAADAAAIERIYCDVVGGDLRPVVAWTRGLSVKRRIGCDRAGSGRQRDGAASGNGATLSSRAVEQAAAGDQGKGRQQNF